LFNLKATAAQSLLGSGFKVTQSHGKVQQPDGFPPIIATLHPSAILRARTDEDRERDNKIFLNDLRTHHRLSEEITPSFHLSAG
jgi:DNA polymerase